MPSTAPCFTIVPSYTPEFPPTSTSSSMITGSAPTGSSTPPICAAAEIWQLLPTCAHEPTSACESIIVSSPTYAPTFTNIGGMQITPRPMYAPSRMLEPPGHNAHAIRQRNRAHRISGFVEERLAPRVDGHIHNCAHAKPEQNPFFHPRHSPASPWERPHPVRRREFLRDSARS